MYRRRLFLELFCLIIAISFFIFSKADVVARVNLPGEKLQIPIDPNTHTTLKQFFNDYTHSNLKSIDKGIEQKLVSILPEKYTLGCKEMSTHWGTVAENTENFSVRNIAYIVSEYTIMENNQLKEKGKLKYRWNSEKRSFEELKQKNGIRNTINHHAP